MKLLGLSCGKKYGNNESLLKEALLAAEETGEIEAKMVRLLDLDIKPCNGCLSCAMGLFRGGSGKCTIRDDFAFLDELFMESDAIILSAPVFVLGPNGILKVLADRMGPSHDVSWRMDSVRFAEQNGNVAGSGPDERSYKNRVGAFIATGGASTQNWLSLGLPLMHLNTMASQVKIVDQMEVTCISQFLHVVMRPEHIERARKLGQNVACAMKKPAEQVQWLGKDEGSCPVCHSNLLTVTHKNPVECAICGIRGELRLDGDRITVTFSQQEQDRSRLRLGGLKEHREELKANAGMAMQRTDMREMAERIGKYRSAKYEALVIPPPEKSPASSHAAQIRSPSPVG
jgi:multimeric flavodoxin WrbA